MEVDAGLEEERPPPPILVNGPAGEGGPQEDAHTDPRRRHPARQPPTPLKVLLDGYGPHSEEITKGYTCWNAKNK